MKAELGAKQVRLMQTMINKCDFSRNFFAKVLNKDCILGGKYAYGGTRRLCLPLDKLHEF